MMFLKYIFSKFIWLSKGRYYIQISLLSAPLHSRPDNVDV